MRDKRYKTRSEDIRRLSRLPPLVSLLSLLLATSAVTAENKKEKWYQVEVIIFQQQDHYRQEEPRRDIQLSYPTNYLELIDPTLPTVEEVSDTGAGQEALPIVITSEAKYDTEQPFIMLDKAQRLMNNEATTLRRRSGYQVLFHQAWRQPGMDSRNASWILVRAGDNYERHFELEGSLRVVLSNYLHLQTDMWLSSFTENFGQEIEAWPSLPDYPIAEISENSDQTTESEVSHSEFDNSLSDNNLKPQVNTDELGSEDGLSWPLPGIENEPESAHLITSIDRFNTNRKLKLNEIHYLDHPRMGVMVRVSRYELPEPKPEPLPLTPTSQTVGEKSSHSMK